MASLLVGLMMIGFGSRQNSGRAFTSGAARGR
jgi:hypothetical protein